MNSGIDFKSKILKEIEGWQKEGLISSDQARNLKERYSLPEITSEKSALAKIITVLSIFGSILLGVGVILFFASNWRGILKPIKLGLIISSIFISYSAGYTLSYVKQDYSKTGKAIILLGSILFGAGIYLVAQIYHFPANYPGGVLFWALGILPIAYILSLNSILFLSSILLILWNILRLTGLDQPNYFYLLFISLPFLLSYRIKSNRLIFTNLLGLIIWFVSHFYFWNKSFEIFLNIIWLLNMGILFYIIGRLHETTLKLNGLKYAYKFLGIILILLNTYLLTCDFVYTNIYSKISYDSLQIIIMNFIVLGFTVTALFFYFFKQKKRRKIISYEFLGFLVVILLTVICLIFPQQIKYNQGRFLLYPVIFNLVLFLEIIGVIILGYILKEVSSVNMGILFFVIQILTVYFSVLWELLPRSWFFIGGGIILLVAGGYLEKKRKYIIARIKSGESILNEPKA